MFVACTVETSGYTVRKEIWGLHSTNICWIHCKKKNLWTAQYKHLLDTLSEKNVCGKRRTNNYWIHCQERMFVASAVPTSAGYTVRKECFWPAQYKHLLDTLSEKNAWGLHSTNICWIHCQKRMLVACKVPTSAACRIVSFYQCCF